jgi:2-polyprenyl-3-methyl-5-hydroxy-6-metoxy-1,4-benzoquinol methylase
MEFTGERVVPGKVEADLFNEHMARYLFARELVSDKCVLDLGCGSGYGTAELSKRAALVTGVDQSAEAVSYAHQQYSSVNQVFTVGDCTALPFHEHSFDVAVCFEVVEHLSNQEALLREAVRVLKPKGFLIISTPNRVFYTEERKEVNRYHTREFDLEEFSGFLHETFPIVRMFFQNHQDIIFIGDPAVQQENIIRQEKQSLTLTQDNFFLAVCALESAGLPDCHNLTFIPSTTNLLREQRIFIEELEHRVATKDAKILRMQQEYDARTAWSLEVEQQLKESNQWAEQLNQKILQLDQRIVALQAEVQEKIAWAKQQEIEIQSRDQAVRNLQEEYEQRTQWALSLDSELRQCQNDFQNCRAQLDETETKLNDIHSRKLYKLLAKLRLLPKG